MFTLNSEKFPFKSKQEKLYLLSLTSSNAEISFFSICQELNSSNVVLFLNHILEIDRSKFGGNYINSIQISKRTRIFNLIGTTEKSLAGKLKQKFEINIDITDKIKLKTKFEKLDYQNIQIILFEIFKKYLTILEQTNSLTFTNIQYYPVLCDSQEITNLDKQNRSENYDRKFYSFIMKFLSYNLTIARDLKTKHQHDEAILILVKIEEMFNIINNSGLETDSNTLIELYDNLGELYYHESKNESAFKAFNMVVKLSKKIMNHSKVAAGYYRLAVLAYNRGRDKEADEYFYKVIKNLDKNKKSYDFHKIFEYQGKFSLIKNEISIAKINFEKLLNEAIRLDDDFIRMDAYFNLSSTLFIENDYKKALEYISNYIEIAEKISDNFELLYAYDLLVAIYTKENKSTQLLNVLYKLSELSIKFKNPFFEARANLRLGMSLIKYGSLKEAEISLIKSEIYFQKTDNRRELKFIWFHLGEIYFTNYLYKKATGYFLKAKKLSNLDDKLFNTGRIEYYLGMISLANNKLDKAIRHFKKQYEISIMNSDYDFSDLAQKMLNKFPNTIN
ncbi:MAG: hypothetical protein JXR48_04550 [Candidatus Delongbacteria bacterium]|nr:hypothetical protein [Candidatus Delongbacteria bacterium]MBN2834218.1 hypothetical protein [Candidatus Delongbacteria bacterium]